jgi:hypothetical protein
LKILHYQHNGVGVVLSEAMNQLGQTSRVVATNEHPMGFREDYLLRAYFRPRRLATRLAWIRFYWYDIFHSHDSVPPPRYVMKRYKGRFVQHYHWHDMRAQICEADLNFVANPGLTNMFPNAKWVPYPVDTERFAEKPLNDSKTLRVGYNAQSLDTYKRKYIPIAELESIRHKSVELRPILDMVPNTKMREYYSTIDVWVDRIGLDFYGFATVEAAAMGIPIITQISPSNLQAINSASVQPCPFIVVQSRSEVPTAVIKLLHNSKFRQEAGQKARTYVVNTHDMFNVARKCISWYSELL